MRIRQYKFPPLDPNNHVVCDDQQSVDDTASVTVNGFLLSRFKWQDSSLGIQVHALPSRNTTQKSIMGREIIPG